MSLSPDAISRHVQVSQPNAALTRLAFPLILVSVALALFLIFAVFSPAPGIDSFLVGP